MIILQPSNLLSKKRAYTIWEVLFGAVAVVAIGWAGAVVFAGEPRHDRDSCITHVKQLATAMVIYSLDSDNRLPQANWMDGLDPVLKESQVFRCPRVEEKGKVSEYGYAMNQEAKEASLFNLKVDFPLIFDSSNLQKNAITSFQTLPNPPRHGSENIVGYVDGSVRPVSRP